MSLPSDFIFSQASLQDYVDCPRRFQLRYLLRIAWPAPLAEPVAEAERQLQLGADFHRLVHQHLIGIPAEALGATIEDADLRTWWEAYLSLGPDVPGTLYPEVTLSLPLAGYRLIAKLDLVAASPGEQLVIVDWKTNQKRPSRSWLEKRLQTRVYRYILAAAGKRFNAGRDVDPEQIEMRYWFAAFPAQTERFRYGHTAFVEDRAYLEKLISEIVARAGMGDMEQTADTRLCRYCRYPSFCERSFGPGEWESEEADLEDAAFDFDLDLEQVLEVEF